MADQTAVGKEFPPFTWEVERGKIREFVQAIGDKNPIYTDKEAAVRAGYKDSPAPPTFPIVLVMWTNMLWESFSAAKINFERALHGEEIYEYYQEIYPNDVLTGRMKIVGMETKFGGTGGKMDIIRLEILYTNQRNEPVLKAMTVLVESK